MKFELTGHSRCDISRLDAESCEGELALVAVDTGEK